MKAERWRRVNELFHEALERGPGDRAVFLDAACAGDAELRAEVESLLASHEEAEGFIEAPAYEVASDLLGTVDSGPEAAPLVGKRLGPYEIARDLGRGGMGVVYLAHDTRLDRRVAIKALADHLVLDQRSRERLRREAKAAAALSHSGVATVFALEEFDGNLYVVYEYADGETLREELEGGPLDLESLISTAVAIGRALEAAHGIGIVHRDLKPENVIRTRDGEIKVLDFGLAKFLTTPAESVGSSETRLTLPGTLLGTPSYMAPEQLRGAEVDFRADIFSLGVVLYELATGIHPFEGGDPASTISRILEVEPFAAASHDGVDHAELSAILRRCVHKAPGERYTTTSELVAALEALVPISAAGERNAPRSSASPQVAPVSPRHDAFWWWRFHQLVLGFALFAVLYPMWRVKEAAAGGDLRPPGALWAAVLFFVALAPVVVAGSLRVHLAFAARYYPDELTRQRRKALPWIRAAELTLAPILLSGAAIIASVVPLVATVLVGAAIAVVVLSWLVEPTTTRAAFPNETPGDRKAGS